jgi:type IV secretory pathway TraG/TraD family ATPase VirD4
MGMEQELFKVIKMLFSVGKVAVKGTMMTVNAIESYEKYKNAQGNYNTQPTAPPMLTTAESGYIFGKVDNRLITKAEHVDGHVLVVGGVGSGKSSCVVIPTLRAWNSGVFAIDIKGELYEKCHEYRPNIKVFNLLG